MKENNKLIRSLNWVPLGKPKWHEGWINGYARGLELIFKYLGHDIDYDTIMGDLGQAFIIQGEEDSINLIDGTPDVGWWPLEPVSMSRFGFLEKTVGREIHSVKPDWDIVKNYNGDSFKKWFEPMIRDSLDKSRPCIVQIGSTWYIITGYNELDATLTGMCVNEESGKERIYCIEQPMPPYAGISVGETIASIDRKQADINALKYAVELHYDHIFGSNAILTAEYPERHSDVFGKYWRTGMISLDYWIKCLEDMEHLGQNFWHGNEAGHLIRNRRTAIRYLKAMQQRHSQSFASCLDEAIRLYEKVIAEMGKADLSQSALGSELGRRDLISILKTIGNLESSAAEKLDQAADMPE